MPAPTRADAAGGAQLIADNRKARHDYHVFDTYEGGIVLLGTEVKAIREGRVNLKDSYGKVEAGEVSCTTCTSAPTATAATPRTSPLRRRKLLLNKREIRKPIGRMVERGFTLVPVRMYFSRGLVKVTVGVAKGKKSYDKRETIKRRQIDRETRAMVKERAR